MGVLPYIDYFLIVPSVGNCSDVRDCVMASSEFGELMRTLGLEGKGRMGE